MQWVLSLERVNGPLLVRCMLTTQAPAYTDTALAHPLEVNQGCFHALHVRDDF